MTGLVLDLYVIMLSAAVLGDLHLHSRNQPWSRTPDGSTTARVTQPPAGTRKQAGVERLPHTLPRSASTPAPALTGAAFRAPAAAPVSPHPRSA